MLVVSSANEVRTWNADSSFQPINEHIFNNQLKPINSFAVRPDGLQISGIIDNSTIGIWDFENDLDIIKEAAHAKTCCYDSSGRFLAVGNSNGYIDVYDFKSQNFKKKSIKILPNPNESINCIAYTSRDRFIVTGNSNGSIVLYNTLTNQIVSTLLPSNTKRGLQNYPLTSFNYSTLNSSNLVAGYEDGSIILWDINKGVASYANKSHSLPCTSVVLSPVNDFFLVSGGLDGCLTFHDKTSSNKLPTIKCSNAITSIDLHKNGSTLCVGTLDGTIQMFDLRSKVDEAILTFKAHDSAISCIKFTQHSNNSNNISMMSSVSNNHLSFTSNSSVGQPDQKLINNVATYPTLSFCSPDTQTTYQSKTILKESINTSNQMIVNDTYANDSYIMNNNSSKKLPSSYSKSTSNLLSGPGFSSTKYDSSITNENINKFFLNDEKSNTKLYGNSSKVSKRADLYSPISNNTFKTDNIYQIKDTLPIIDQNGASPKLSQSKQAPNIVVTRSIESPLSEINNHSKSTVVKSPVKENSTTMMIVDETKPQIEKEEVQYSNTNNINLNNNQQSFESLENIRNIVKDIVEDFRDELMSENFKFKAEMIKEFMSLRDDMCRAIQSCSINQDMVEEIARLKEENKRLKKLF